MRSTRRWRHASPATPSEILALEAQASVWEETLACEPHPRLLLEGEALDRGLAAMGNFADLISPYLAGHSAGVAELAEAAARRCRIDEGGVVALRRAALVHDLGRVAVDARIWQKRGPLSADEWERVRLHPYHSERVLARSEFLARWRRSPERTTSASTAPATTVRRSARSLRFPRACSPPPTPTTR